MDFLPRGHHEDEIPNRRPFFDQAGQNAWHQQRDWPYIGTTFAGERHADPIAMPGWIAIASRHKGLLALSACLGALAGWLITLPQTPLYQARASVEVLPVNENFLNINNLSPTSQSSSDQDIQTQVRILTSRSVVDRTVQLLQARGKGASIETAAKSVRAFPADKTRLIELSCESPDPKISAEFLNTLAKVFIDENLIERGLGARRTAERLESQLSEFKSKLEGSESQLQKYAGSSGLLITSDKRNIAEQKLEQIQTELARVETERAARETRFKMAVSSPPDTLPEVLENSVLRDHQIKVTDLRRQLAELSSTLTPANYKVQRVQAQIRSLEGAMDSERSNLVNRIRNAYEDALQRERMLRSAYRAQVAVMNDQAGKGVQHNILQREVETDRQLYDSLLQKVKEAGIAAAVRQSNVRVVDSADIPREPFKPDPYLSSAMGLFGGLMLGGLLTFVRSSAGRQIRQPGETEELLNIPELGAVISAHAEPVESMMTGRHGPVGRLLRRRGQGDEYLSLDAERRDGTLLAESFRSTVASILSKQRHNRVIVIASPTPRDGKTTIVSNLAITFAIMNQRVVVIDGDLRKPKLHSVCGVSNDYGLSDVLSETTPIEEYATEDLGVRTKIPGLWVLPSGSQLRVNLLYTTRLAELLRRLRRDFDFVLLDSPAMLYLSDARILAGMSDGVILVVRARHTDREALMTAAQRFSSDGTPLLGSILNDWDPRRGSAPYYNQRDYYYYQP
jgi:succinoglycan biosynthesis transport protein ExoP